MAFLQGPPRGVDSSSSSSSTPSALLEEDAQQGSAQKEQTSTRSRSTALLLQEHGLGVTPKFAHELRSAVVIEGQVSFEGSHCAVEDQGLMWSCEDREGFCELSAAL